MANNTVDNLNFEVILDDAEFNKKIQELEKTAQKFNTSMSNLLNIQKASQQWSQKDVENNRRAHQAKVDEARAQEKINREKIKTDGLQRKINAQIQRASKGYSDQVSILKQMQSIALGYLSINGVSRLLSSLVRVTGEFELQKTTLASMLQDMSQAETIMTRIKGLAVESPFTFGELSTYAKQLSAFSVPAKELYETTKMLADVSAGLGVGMDRIVLAYGQVRSAAFLRGQEVRQFTEAGIPILNELAKQFEELEGQAVSTGEVFDRISSRLVPFEMVAQVLKNMTSEGGKFYNMQSIQSETLRGKVLKLKDAYQIMLNEIGESKSGRMKSALDGVQNLMKNWAKVGAILKTIIITYGAYQGALALVWVAEKTLAGVELYKKWQAMNAITVALTGNTYKLAAAIQVLGKSAKVALGLVIGLLAGIITSIVAATQNARRLNKELESIMSAEVSGSERTVEGLEQLKEKLKNATQGSQEYRDAISELNRKYGEYLPKIYSEKDAYDAVKVAAEGAAQAIRNKAKASAFEKGYAEIEESYGGQLTRFSKGLETAITFINPNIARENAIEFIKRFRETIEKEGEGDGFYNTFSRLYKEFFDSDNLVYSLAQIDLKLKGYSTDFEKLVNNYGKAANNVIQKQKELDEELELRFGSSNFSSIAEREEISKVDEWYKTEQENLKKLKISQEEYNDKVEDLDLQKLQKLVEVYTKLGRTDIAKDYQSHIDDLTKVPEGWRGKVQNVLKGMNLGKNTSFGLWADETTRSVSYVEDMVKRYKELDDEIKAVSPFDASQANRLKKELSAIEAISKALNIDIKELAATGADTAESKEEKRLKRLIASLRTLHEEANKLKSVGAIDKDIKTLFEGLYPELVEELGDEWETTTDYLQLAIKYAEKLKTLNADAGKKAFVDLGKDEFSEYYNKLKQKEKAYKDSAEAAKKYFNLLRKWSTEEFNLNGEGITLDVSKIASDLSAKINEIELTATKAKEIFGQIDVDSEEEVAKVKEIFIKEFGEDAWTEFWNAYYTKGTSAIDALALKQKEYEKKLAQEKINDLAEKYVKESYFTENIDLTELGDKTYQQLRGLKKRLQGLLDQEPLKISAELETFLLTKGLDVKNLANTDLSEFFDRMEIDKTPIDDATKSMLLLIQQIQKAGLSTEEFGNIIKKVISGDLKELTEEEGKALMSMVKSYMSEMNTLLGSIAEYAEVIGNDELQGAVNGIAQSMEILGSVADKLAKGDWVGAIISGVTSIASVILKAVSAEEELNKSIRETQREMRILASEKAIMEGVESVFGTDDYKKFQDAYEEAVAAHKKATEDIQKQNEKLTGGTKDNWGWGSILGGAGAGAALGAAVGSIVPVIGTLIGALSGAVIGAVTGAIGDTATKINDYAKSLQQMADEIGIELIDSTTGTFNVEALESIKKTYKDLDSEYQEMIDDLIVNATNFENAVTHIATYMTDMFGQCADDMADSFIESFKESGQAALEYEDIVSDVATNIAKSIIKSTILQNVFDDTKAEDAAKKLASGNVAGAIGVVENAMESAKELTPYIQELLESLKPYFNMEEEAGQTLGDGIKGITEDTANLLASYLNAIRADVSYAKVLWQSMDTNTRSIAAVLEGFSAPSLMEYQAQIAANTYNTYTTTQSILNRLNDVITSDGGNGDAIKIYS